jgi:hypothetical protein
VSGFFEHDDELDVALAGIVDERDHERCAAHAVAVVVGLQDW